MTKRILSLGFALLALTSSVVSAAGTLWNVQFSSSSGAPLQTGAAVIGGAGDTWNLCSGSSGSDLSLVDSTGSGLGGVTISWASDGAYDSGDSGFRSTQYSSLMSGYILASSGGSTHTCEITVSGLMPSTSCTVYLFTQGDSGCTGRRMNATTDNWTTTTTSTAAVASANTFVLDQNYLRLTAQADATGSFTIDVSMVGSYEADINGLQIAGTPVPEPATWALLASGLCGAFCIVRRRR